MPHIESIRAVAELRQAVQRAVASPPPPPPFAPVPHPPSLLPPAPAPAPVLLPTLQTNIPLQHRLTAVVAAPRPVAAAPVTVSSKATIGSGSGRDRGRGRGRGGRSWDTDEEVEDDDDDDSGTSDGTSQLSGVFDDEDEENGGEMDDPYADPVFDAALAAAEASTDASAEDGPLAWDAGTAAADPDIEPPLPDSPVDIDGSGPIDLDAEPAGAVADDSGPGTAVEAGGRLLRPLTARLEAATAAADAAANSAFAAASDEDGEEMEIRPDPDFASVQQRAYDAALAALRELDAQDGRGSATTVRPLSQARGVLLFVYFH
jgi:hypothetical protein